MTTDTGKPDDEFTTLVREQTAAAFGFLWSGTLHYHPAGAPRRMTRRCLACHPGAWTSSLCIDGREYRRRLRARRRRKR